MKGSIVRIVRSEKLDFFRLDDSLIAIDKQGGYCYALNSTSARIWELIATPTHIASIRDLLCQEFDVDPDDCLNDIAEIICEMKDAGIVSEWRG
jgi:hypothetical protein